jgi:hypothetical protein
MQLMTTRTDLIDDQPAPELNQDMGAGLINLLYFLFR